MPAGVVGAVPIAITRQKTSKQRLRIDWDYPVFKKPDLSALPAMETVAVMPDRALEREEAFTYVVADDPRPLLVLRECVFCVGTEVALLSRTKENDRTLLLAQWFHCVKLPNDVLGEEHPFRNLFGREQPAHLFLADRDGSGVIPLSGAQSQSDLWRAMESVLRRNYEDSPERAVKEHLKLLAHLDHLDSREDLLKEQIDLEIEKNGPDSGKVRRRMKELEKIQQEREKALAREQEIVDLELRKQEEAAPAVASRTEP